MTQVAQGVLEHQEFPVLDSLRAVGALAVLTTHTSFQAGEYLRHGTFGTLLARLDVGVALFFVLSGFLLSRRWLATAALGQRRPTAVRYYEKRLLRVYPVYVVTVAVALLLVPGNGTPSLAQWTTSLLLADPYVDQQLPHGLTHMWSLTAEVAFYALLPPVMLLAAGTGLRTSRILGVIGAMVLVSVSWHLWLERLIAPHVNGATGIWLPAYLSWFAIGIWLAWVHVRLQANSGGRVLQTVARVARQPGTCWTMIAGLMLVAATPLAGPTLFEVGTAGESLAKHLVYGLVGGLAVMSGVWTVPGSPWERTMSARPLRHLGHISYSVFCIHLAVISLVMAMTGYQLFDGHGLQIWALTLIITLVVSEGLYRVVELPFLRIKGRLRGGPASRAPNTPPRESTTS